MSHIRALATSFVGSGRFATFSPAHVIGISVVALVLLMVVLPLVVLTFTSVRLTYDKLPFEDTVFTFENYTRILAASKTYGVLLNTFWYAAGAVVVGFLLAMVFSWLFERTNMPFRSTM